MPTRIWLGPFRGARIVLNPRDSLRKISGLYEHELNKWLEAALGRVERVIDVGANDGYFTFGCVAAFRRLEKRGAIVAFEPQMQHVRQLQASAAELKDAAVDVQIVEQLVGCEVRADMTTLDALTGPFSGAQPRTNTLIKIDVEGSEMDVIAGAESWLHPSNAFLIEVHAAAFLDPLKKGFATRGLRLRQINQRPLPFLGRESREQENWWLVSDFTAL